MTIRKDGRHCISVTLGPDLYERLMKDCQERDLPTTVWCREAILRQLERLTRLEQDVEP